MAENFGLLQTFANFRPKIDSSTAFQFPNDYKLPTVCKFNLQLHKVNKPQQELPGTKFLRC